MYLENFKELTTAIAEKETDPAEALKMGDYLYDRTSKFVNYFNKVCDHMIKGEIAHQMFHAGKLSRENMLFQIERLDGNRRSAHDMAAVACTQINRLCDTYQVQPFCPDTTDRHEVAEFVGRFVQEVYQDGIKDRSLEKNNFKAGHSLDDAFTYAKMESKKLKAKGSDVKEKMEEKWKEAKESR